MKLVRRLSQQVMLTTIVTGVIGAAVVLVQVSMTVRRAIGESIRGIYLESERPRCEANPSTFRLLGPGDLETWAYDTDGRSANPAAPPFEQYGAAAVLRGTDSSERATGGTGGAVTFRAAPSGPCAVIVSHWTGRFATASAARLLVSTTLLTVLAGAGVGLVFVVWPLSRRTRKLREAAAALGSTVGPLSEPRGDELDVALAGLTEADARIRQDAATLAERSTALRRHLGEVAHDVRTPLAAMQLALEQALGSTTDEATREPVARALAECVFVASVTENLRLKSLVEEGVAPTPRQLPDLAAVVERLVLRARLLATHRGVRVEMSKPDAPIAVFADDVFLERCVANLVDNAVRHAPAGGHVAVLVSGAGGAFQVVVRDDGAGVTADELSQLGQRLFRGDEARQRDPRGSGLGLSITSALSARCGWTLSFANLEPHGLEVALRDSTPTQHGAGTVSAVDGHRAS
ncbi:MAG: HAMP domain-containing sensor histidine kinase [Myxococcaceae bacterium]|nr:HAMP domain-containing sensor histidine kinase [Myxococcaceae bacterium]